MESFILSFHSIAPLFILMFLGYMLKKTKLLNKTICDGTNKVIFKIFLPTLLFYNIYKTDLGSVFDGNLILFTLLGVLTVFILSYFTVIHVTKDNAKRGVMLQGFFRSNYAILGLPLITYICGEDSGGLSSLMVAVIVPFFNVLAVIALERFRDGQINIKKLLKGIVTNPLIIGCACGGLLLVSGITLPSFLEKSVKDVASIASPLALVVLGGSFSFSQIKEGIKELIITVTARLVVIPLVMISIAAVLGFRGEALACIMVAFGSPVAVSSFTMAQQMGGDEKLAAEVVVVSSAACLITFFVWIFALDSFGLF